MSSSSSRSSSSSSSEDEQSINNEETMQLEEEEASRGPSQEEDSHAPEGATEAPPQTTMVAPTLSKSWSVASAHVPIFTGGKVVPCHVQTDKRHSHEKDNNESDASNITIPCLLLPVNGDIAVVDAQRGIKLGSVRAGTSGNLYNHNDDDDDDDGLDADAITAYALSANQKILVTCTQNHLVRQYSCHVTTTSTEKSTDKKSVIDAPDEATQPTANANATEKNVISVQLQKTWGRSGHSLPVTDMEFHSSGVFVASASVDGSVRIWDVRGGHVTHIFRPLAGGSGGGSARLSVTAIRWLDDIAHLVIAIGRDDGSIAIHDLRDQDMKHVVMLRDHLSAVTCMHWWWKGNTNNDDMQEPHHGGSSNITYPSMFVTTSRDAVLNFWSIDQSSAKQSKLKKAKNTKSKHSTVDFKKAASAPVYRREQTIPLYEQVEGMVLLPDHEDDSALTVVTAGSKGVVRLWKAYQADDGDISAPILSTKQPTSQAYGESRGGYLGLIFMKAANFRSGNHISSSSPHNQLLVADAEHCLSFLSLDSSAEEALETERTIVGFNDEILDLRVIPTMGTAAEPSSIVVATNSAQVRIFDLDNFSCHVLDGHTATVLCVDVSPCGRYIATSGKDKRMCIWQTENRKCVAIAVGHTEAIGAAALSRKAGRFHLFFFLLCYVVMVL